MEYDAARDRLRSERAEIARLLAGTETAVGQGRPAHGEVGDSADSAVALANVGVDDAIAAQLRDRVGAIDRALRRLDDGTYGLSVRSGRPIPEERLDADPAAELTIEEARAR
jgi:DnaK suppressor protein